MLGGSTSAPQSTTLSCCRMTAWLNLTRVYSYCDYINDNSVNTMYRIAAWSCRQSVFKGTTTTQTLCFKHQRVYRTLPTEKQITLHLRQRYHCDLCRMQQPGLKHSQVTRRARLDRAKLTVHVSRSQACGNTSVDQISARVELDNRMDNCSFTSSHFMHWMVHTFPLL